MVSFFLCIHRRFSFNVASSLDFCTGASELNEQDLIVVGGLVDVCPALFAYKFTLNKCNQFDVFFDFRLFTL